MMGAVKFEETRWSLVRRSARPDTAGQAALSDLCEQYWGPLYSYARSRGRGPSDAEDDVQGFLAKVIQGDLFKGADPERGKLRTFLLTAFQHWMNDEWKRERAQKRGGGIATVSLDEEERGYFELAESGSDASAIFDQRWAMRTVEEALKRLRDRYQEKDYILYRPHLLGNQSNYQVCAEKSGLSSSGFKVGIHRMRKRFREELEAVVLQTVASRSDLQEEMGYLLEVLTRCSIDGRET